MKKIRLFIMLCMIIFASCFLFDFKLNNCNFIVFAVNEYEVEDAQEPEIIIADTDNTENPGEVKDVEYKLQSNFVNGENVVIKAIYATDAVDLDTIVTEKTIAFGKLPEALNEGKLELGESITLPVPEYPEGYHYTVNVRGPVDSKLTKEIFTPKKVGTYTLVYDLYETSSGTIKDTKEFKVEVKDTTAPEVRVEWNLENSYKAGTDTKVLIPVFSATDVSGINLEESKIVISSKSYSRTIKGSEMKGLLEKYNEYLDDNTKDPGNLLVTLRYNEEYKVTYTVYDNSTNKNSTTQSYTIKVGDLVAPVIDVEDNIVASTQKINQNLVIDVSKIDLLDNETATGDIKLKITVKNTTTGAEIKNIYEEEDGKFEYAIDTAGEYTVTFKAIDAVGNETTITRSFTVIPNDYNEICDNIKKCFSYKQSKDFVNINLDYLNLINLQNEYEVFLNVLDIEIYNSNILMKKFDDVFSNIENISYQLKTTGEYSIRVHLLINGKYTEVCLGTFYYSNTNFILIVFIIISILVIATVVILLVCLKRNKKI